MPGKSAKLYAEYLINGSFFTSGEGRTYDLGNHVIKFFPNVGRPVYNLIVECRGYFEFDYLNKHYSHKASPNATVFIGTSEAVITDYE